ncbi:MAG: transposase [Deltaproteobacteria bacterium]|nr:transposase [Deltaproteobacteria bacterium]
MNDQIAKDKNMTSEERLIFQQAESKPLMDALCLWFHKQLDEKLVESNSGLGKAINYMLNHWKPLTRFLQVPGTPLDNNVCERALKKAIIHCKPRERKHELAEKYLPQDPKYKGLFLIPDLVTRGDFTPRFLDISLFEGRISDFKLK